MHHEPHAFADIFYERLGSNNGGGKRLLTHHVHAKVSSAADQGCMRPNRRCNVDGIYLLVGKHRLEIWVGLGYLEFS